MKPSIVTLIKETIKLIKKDKIIFCPPIISSFLIYTITLKFPVTDLLTLSITSISIILILLCLYLITFGFGVKMSNALYNNEEITPELFSNVLKRNTFKLILSALFIYIPLTLFILTVQYITDNLITISFISNTPYLKTFISIFTGLITIAGAIFCTYLLFFLPIFIVIDNHKILSSLKTSINYVIRNISQIILLSCIVVNIKILFSLFSFVFLAIPVLGQSFFLVLFKGIGDTIVYSLFVVFYCYGLQLFLR